jgi:hypothetical protein
MNLSAAVGREPTGGHPRAVRKGDLNYPKPFPISH